MAKTPLTLAIENRLYTYDPDSTGGYSINKFRGRHIGYEVPVTTGTTSGGMVDCVRVDEILIYKDNHRACTIGRNPEWYKKNHPYVTNYVRCSKGITNIDEFPEYCDDISCPTGCILKEYDNEIAITCYEIKVSKDDFHSTHGHNFCGNANYYVMPDELYKQVKNEIPQDIGCIVYKRTEKSETLRRVKECEWKSLDAETQRWMLINVMKKLRSWKDVHIIDAAVKHMHSMLEKSCITCDFREDCPYPECCNVTTHNPEHSCMWKCQDDELRSAGIYVGDHGQEANLFV